MSCKLLLFWLLLESSLFKYKNKDTPWGKKKLGSQTAWHQDTQNKNPVSTLLRTIYATRYLPFKAISQETGQQEDDM